MKVGIIGTGNMGTVLIQAFLDAMAVDQTDLYITNRTREKAERLLEDYPELHVMECAVDVAKAAEMTFICVKPLDIKPLLQEMRKVLGRDKLLVSITSPVSVEELQSVVDCHVARAIPSITNRALAGVSLVTFGKSCGEREKEQLYALLEHISKPCKINEDITRVASDIVSCGPAFFTYLTERFIEAAEAETAITKGEATVFASEMLIGLGKLLEKDFYTLPSLREKVHVKGGVTGEGLSVLEAEVGDMFNQLYKKTQEKYAEDRNKVQNQFKL